MENTNHQLLMLSWVLKKGYERNLEEILSHYHLSQNEGRVLLFLHHHPMATAKDISAYRSISKSLVSKSVDSLRERGYLEMKEDLDDKRIRRLYLKEASNSLVNELVLAQERFYHIMKKDLSSNELQIMDRVIKKISKNISRELEELERKD